MQLQIDKLGKVSITVEENYWDINKDYDKLTVVEKEGTFGTFISRKPVPAGTVLTDRKYWIPFSSLKEQIIIDYNKFIDTFSEIINNHEIRIDNVENLKNKIEDVILNTNTIIDNNKILLEETRNIIERANNALNKAQNLIDAYEENKDEINEIVNASKDIVDELLSIKGKANGLATLDEHGKVPSNQLPSYVYNVLEYNTLSDFPSIGEKGKIYIAIDNNKQYRWTGSIYTKISNDEYILNIGNFTSIDSAVTYAAKGNIAGNKTKFIIVFTVDNINSCCFILQIYNAITNKTIQYLYDANKVSVRTITEVYGNESDATVASAFEITNPHNLKYNENFRQLYFTNYENHRLKTSITLPKANGNVSGLSDYNLTEDIYNKLNNIAENIHLKTIDNKLEFSNDNITYKELAFNEDVQAIKDLVIGMHTSITVSVTPSLIEKGVNNTITINSSVKFNNTQNLTHTKIIKVGNNIVNNPHIINDATSFVVQIDINNDDPKLITSTTRTVSVNAVYPRYYGRLNKESINSSDILNLTKQFISTSPNGNYTFNSENTDYLWLCIPNTMNINRVTSSGFDVAMNSFINVEVKDKGIYKCYRSALKLNPGSVTITIQ